MPLIEILSNLISALDTWILAVLSKSTSDTETIFFPSVSATGLPKLSKLLTVVLKIL